jgi:SSS family solute:Na+ symporter
LVSGLGVYVVGSLLSKPTDPLVLAEWDRRSRGESTAKLTLQQTPSV